MVVLGMVVLAMATGATPVALAVAGRHPLKLSVASFSAAGITPTLGSFETLGGQRRTEVVFALRGLTVRGLCLSSRIATPAGVYVLRITSPTLRSERLAVALDSIDSLRLLGPRLNVGTLLPVAPSSHQPVPLGSSDEPGLLSLRVGNMIGDLRVTLRWLTASRLDLGDVRISKGLAKPECF